MIFMLQYLQQTFGWLFKTSLLAESIQKLMREIQEKSPVLQLDSLFGGATGTRTLDPRLAKAVL